MEWLIPIIICVLAGVILLIVEAFMPGFGVPGISGIILLLAGVAMTWYEYGAMVGLGTTVAVLALVAWRYPYRSNPRPAAGCQNPI